MRLEIRSKGVEVGPRLRDSIKRRLRYVLGRFGGRIGRLTVDIAELASPDRPEARRCRIVARLIGSQKLCVEDTGPDLAAVVELAIHRVGQLVRREIQRQRYELDGSTTKSRTI
jgi:ribosome-associated translation inhibitor RaiA